MIAKRKSSYITLQHEESARSSSLYTSVSSFLGTYAKREAVGRHKVKALRSEYVSLSPTLLYDKKIEQRITRLEVRIKKTVTSKKTQIASTKIYDLPSDSYELNEAIDVVLKFEEGEVIAVIPELELHADGSNEIEAINELKLELLDLFDDLNEMSDDELHATPKSWKKIINKLIKHGD